MLNPSPYTKFNLKSIHCPNFWDVFVNVILEVMILFMSALKKLKFTCKKISKIAVELCQKMNIFWHVTKLCEKIHNRTIRKIFHLNWITWQKISFILLNFWESWLPSNERKFYELTTSYLKLFSWKFSMFFLVWNYSPV